MLLLFLILTSGWTLSFPGTNSGSLEPRMFFQPDEDQFIYTMIEDNATLVRYGPVTFRIGLALDTFMGTSSKDSDIAFNVYGGHWNIRGLFGIDYKNLLFSLFTDHQCFHNIDMADTSGQYMNTLKLGIENHTLPIMMESHAVFLPAGNIPNYQTSIGFYRPSNATFQKGHVFNWSIHGNLNYPLLSAKEMVYGTIWHSDLFFHLDGETSSRHSGEIYAKHNDITIFIRHYLHDTQPIRPLDKETCFGLRFSW